MYYHIYSSQSYIFVQNFSANHRNSKKTTTFAFNKRSVTYLRKCPITQHIVSDSGHSTKGLKRGGTTRICNTMKYSGLHLSPHSVYLSKQRLYRLKWMVADNQWCKYAASVSSWLSTILQYIANCLKATVLVAFFILTLSIWNLLQPVFKGKFGSNIVPIPKFCDQMAIGKWHIWHLMQKLQKW